MRRLYIVWSEFFGLVVMSAEAFGIRLTTSRVLRAGFDPIGALVVDLVHCYLYRVSNLLGCLIVMRSLIGKRVHS